MPAKITVMFKYCVAVLASRPCTGMETGPPTSSYCPAAASKCLTAKCPASRSTSRLSFRDGEETSRALIDRTDLKDGFNAGKTTCKGVHYEGIL